MAKRTAEQIIRETMPDVELVEKPAAKADASIRFGSKPGPSIEDLRRKFLGNDAFLAEETPEAAYTDSPESSDDIEVKVVRSRRPPVDGGDPVKDRTVILSSERGIVGSQG